MMSLSHMTRCQGSTGHHCHTRIKSVYSIMSKGIILTHGGIDPVFLAAVVGDHSAGGGVVTPIMVM